MEEKLNSVAAKSSLLINQLVTNISGISVGASASIRKNVLGGRQRFILDIALAGVDDKQHELN